MEIKKIVKITLAASLLSLTSVSQASHSPVGQWTLGYDWNCDGSYSKTTITFNADNTFPWGASTGKWWEEHSQFTFVFPSGTTYTAYHVNKSMTGVSRSSGSLSGCWYAHPNDGFNYDIMDTAPADGIDADGTDTNASPGGASPEPGLEG